MNMFKELVRNEWAVILQHAEILEIRWLGSTSTMTDGGCMATLCLLASEAEKARPRGILVDAREFRYDLGEASITWREAHIVPRYGGAGVRRLAFIVPSGSPRAGKEIVEGPAVYPTRWFVGREEAMAWMARPPTAA
jgi:hypothetical protein